MKIRSGFVSNSSSSSFVVAFDKKPTNSYEVLEVLFPLDPITGRGEGKVANPYGEGGVDALSAATIVWEQMKDQKPMTKKQILEEIRSGYFEGYPDRDFSVDDEPDQMRKEYKEKTGKDINDEDADPEWKKKWNAAWKKRWDEENKKIDAAAKELLDREYSKKFKGKKCFRFSFSDNDGSVFATLEHGDTFNCLPFLRISHH